MRTPTGEALLLQETSLYQHETYQRYTLTAEVLSVFLAPSHALAWEAGKIKNIFLVEYPFAKDQMGDILGQA